MPKVSVVIPVYNIENYLYNMLDSLKEQSFRDFEAIIIDDGSSDRSYEIISEFADGDNSLKFSGRKIEGYLRLEIGA